LDSNAKGMISSLLRSSSNLRLGMWKNGINGIWEHAFLKGTVVRTFFLSVVLYVLYIEFSFNIRYVMLLSLFFQVSGRKRSVRNLSKHLLCEYATAITTAAVCCSIVLYTHV
jgi:hypothetical protein